MVIFLAIAAKRRYVVDSYVNDAIGLMEKDGDNKISMTKVRLRPHVIFSGNKISTLEQLKKIHHQSHQACFIANSVKTEIVTEMVTERVAEKVIGRVT
jgi:organic hydroperoxide reductase OsmC/OhrA